MKRAWRVILKNGTTCTMVNDVDCNQEQAMQIAEFQFPNRVLRVE